MTPLWLEMGDNWLVSLEVNSTMSGTSSSCPIGGIEVADDSGEDCIVAGTGSVVCVGATVAVIAVVGVDCMGVTVTVCLGCVGVVATSASVPEQALNISKVKAIKNCRLIVGLPFYTQKAG
jgi:hypothetical protein